MVLLYGLGGLRFLVSEVPLCPKREVNTIFGQVVDYMLEGLGKGKFYIICPDNEVSSSSSLFLSSLELSDPRVYEP